MARAREQTKHASQTDNPPAALEAPRFAFGWASLVYLICTFSLAWPALAGKFLVNPHSDQYIAGYAFREFAAATLRATGQFPLWNPYLFGGMPYVAAMHGDIFYPTFLLRLILPTDVAMTWGFIIHLFLAGIFTFGFLRATGFSFPGALAGGLAYMMSGQIASYVSPGHDGKLFVSALFPLALWMLHRGIRGGRASSWGALALIIGLAVLSPHPQLLQYMLLACGAYALFLSLAKLDADPGPFPHEFAVKRLAAALGAVMVGLAMGAVQYLPVREYVPWSPRAGGLANYETATSYAWRPEELLNTYLPQFSGLLDAYWGRNFFHLHSDYVGAVVLVLAGAAFLGLRADPRRRHIIFWSATLFVAVLWSLGSATPFYRIPYAIVPGTKYFRAPATIFFVGALAISVLASAGTERFLQLRVTRKYLIGWLAFAGAMGLLASASVLTAFAASFAEGAQLDRLEANKGGLIVGAWRSFVFVGLTAGLGFALLRQRIPARYAGWGLAALLAVDLWSIERLYWMFSPPASAIYASNEIVETIKAEPQPARVLALPLKETMQSDALLTGDALMSHRVRSVEGYHGNQLARYNQLIGRPEARGRMITPNVLQLTNTKFVLTNIPQIPFLPNAKLVKGPVRDASGEETYLFQLDGVHPYAWLTPVAVKANDEQVLATLLDPRFDVRRAALFDNTADVSVADAVRALPEPLPITATVRRYEPGKVEIDLSVPAPKGAALIVSENFYPGWRAQVDGKPARIGRANLSLIGVELPEGARRVELEFTSPSYETGKTITWIAIVIGLVALAAGIWRDRRRLA
ncbi:MAG: hypothetical protein WD802_05190 [Gemmatimonadaceae bacterium]